MFNLCDLIDGCRDRMVVGFITTLCNQCLLPQKLRVRIPHRQGVLDTALCDKDWRQVIGFFCVLLFSSTNKTDRYDITEILLTVALNTMTLL